MKRNVYIHEVDLENLQIRNRPREEFSKLLERVKYRGYEVEQLADGRKIIITKPGGKFVFGKVRREDLMVWVYDPSDSTLWLISHKDIYSDLEEKGKVNPEETVRIIDALGKVFDGEEPDDVLKGTKLNRLCGEPPEVLVKAYKWIWGQEDCNYPPPMQGRDMSIKAILDLRTKLRDILSV